MRCSEPWWRLSAAVDGQEPPMQRRTISTARTSRRGVADCIPRSCRSSRPSTAAWCRTSSRRRLIPTALFYVFFDHVRAQVGDPRGARLDVRRGRPPVRHRQPDPRPAGARHVGDLRAHRHLPVQRQRASSTSSSRSCARSPPPPCSPSRSCVGRPLIARFADDFCPLTPDLQGRPAVVRAVPPAHLPVGRRQRRRRRGQP